MEWDESDADNSGINGSGGGHIPTIVVSDALRANPRQDPTPVDTGGHLALHRGCLRTGAPRRALGTAANGNIDALLGATPGPGP